MSISFMRLSLLLAGVSRFELELMGLESIVLPLHHTPMAEDLKAINLRTSGPLDPCARLHHPPGSLYGI